MATVVRDHQETPRARTPIPQLRPPVDSFSYQDLSHPEEADEFIAEVRNLRRLEVLDQKNPKPR